MLRSFQEKLKGLQTKPYEKAYLKVEQCLPNLNYKIARDAQICFDVCIYAKMHKSSKNFLGGAFGALVRVYKIWGKCNTAAEF